MATYKKDTEFQGLLDTAPPAKRNAKGKTLASFTTMLVFVVYLFLRKTLHLPLIPDTKLFQTRIFTTNDQFSGEEFKIKLFLSDIDQKQVFHNTSGPVYESVKISIQSLVIGNLEVDLTIVDKTWISDFKNMPPGKKFNQIETEFGEVGKQTQNCHYEGSIGAKNESFAAFSICGSVFGMIRFSDGRIYEIATTTPFFGKGKVDVRDHKHVARYMGVVSANELHHMSEQLSQIHALKRRQLQQTSSSSLASLPVATITIALGIDYDLYNLEKQELESRIIRFMNSFNMFFAASGQRKGNYLVRTFFSKIYVFSKAEYSTNRQAETYLRNWCDDMGPEKVKADASFLVRSGELQPRNGGRILGLSFGKSACSALSCSVITTKSDIMGKGVALSSVRVAVHELMHQIGALDDGVGNTCKRDRLMGMSDTFVESDCSQREIKEFMDNLNNISCLVKNPPTTQPRIDYERSKASPSDSRFATLAPAILAQYADAQTMQDGGEMRKLGDYLIFELDEDTKVGRAIQE